MIGRFLTLNLLLTNQKPVQIWVHAQEQQKFILMGHVALLSDHTDQLSNRVTDSVHSLISFQEIESNIFYETDEQMCK